MGKLKYVESPFLTGYMMKFRQRALFWIVSASLIIAAVSLTLTFTRFGPGASGDSVYYVMGAENIRLGNGFSRTSGGGEIKPITGFPPLYPMVLGLFYSEGTDLFSAARVLNAVLFGLNMLLCTLLLFRYTQSIIATGIGGLLLISSDTIVLLHGWVMSEPLFVFLFLLAIFALIKYFERKHLFWLFLTGLSGGAVIITRYVGVALLPTLMLVAFAFNQKSIKKRFLDVLILTILMLAPLLCLILANASAGGSGINREIAFHMIRPEIGWQYLTEISSWFAPGNLPLHRYLRALIAISIAFGVPVFFLRNFLSDVTSRSKDHDSPYAILPWSLVIYIFSYLAVLLINSLLLDAGTTISAVPRYLMPVYVAVVLLFVSMIYRLINTKWKKPIVWISVMLYAGFLVLVSMLEVVNLLDNPELYVGYSGINITTPELVETLDEINRESIIISNNPEMVFFLMGRSAYMRPIIFDHYSLQYREDYEEQIEFVQSLLDRGAVYIQMRAPSQEEREVIQELEVVQALSIDGAHIYISPKFHGSIFND